MRKMSSLLLLMALIAACAVAIVVLRAAHAGNQYALLACVFLLPVCCYAMLSVPLYLVLYGLGSFNRYVDVRSGGLESPFAEERLPTQIVAPQISEDVA